MTPTDIAELKGKFVHRPYVREQLLVVAVVRNVVLQNEWGVFHTASLDSFKNGEYALCD